MEFEFIEPLRKFAIHIFIFYWWTKLQLKHVAKACPKLTIKPLNHLEEIIKSLEQDQLSHSTASITKSKHMRYTKEFLPLRKYSHLFGNNSQWGRSFTFKVWHLPWKNKSGALIHSRFEIQSCLGPCQTSTIQLFPKIVNRF